MTTLHPQLLAIESIAVDAGKEILRIYDTEFEVESKSDASPLTAADMASHKVITARLAQLTPDIPVLSEESAEEVPWEERAAWNRYWLVDPLDGTKEFVKRNGEFTVNIALIEDQKPVMGVVHVPVQGHTYLGDINHGAHKRVDGKLAVISTRPTPTDGPLVVSRSRSHPSAELEAYLERFGQTETVPLGSSLKFCRLAEGLIDLYPRLGPTSEWDTGAAQAVVEAAGGVVVNTDGSPLRYNTKSSLLNPYFLVLADPSLLSKAVIDS